MIKSISKWLHGVKDAVSLVSKEKPIYVTAYRVPNSFTDLCIYLIPGTVPQYKLVIDPMDGSGFDVRYIDKLFNSQDPIEELATGIHDKAISKFIGAPFNSSTIIK